MKDSTVLKICTWTVLSMFFLCFALILILGCAGPKLDGFASENYVWEGWVISTNKVEVIQSGQ